MKKKKGGKKLSKKRQSQDPSILEENDNENEDENQSDNEEGEENGEDKQNEESKEESMQKGANINNILPANSSPHINSSLPPLFSSSTPHFLSPHNGNVTDNPIYDDENEDEINMMSAFNLQSPEEIQQRQRAAIQEQELQKEEIRQANQLKQLYRERQQREDEERRIKQQWEDEMGRYGQQSYEPPPKLFSPPRHAFHSPHSSFSPPMSPPRLFTSPPRPASSSNFQSFQSPSQFSAPFFTNSSTRIQPPLPYNNSSHLATTDQLNTSVHSISSSTNWLENPDLRHQLEAARIQYQLKQHQERKQAEERRRFEEDIMRKRQEEELYKRKQQEEEERKQKEQERLKALLPKEGVDLIMEYVENKGFLASGVKMHPSEAQRLLDLFLAPSSVATASLPSMSPTSSFHQSSNPAVTSATREVLHLLSTFPPSTSPYKSSLDFVVQVYTFCSENIKKFIREEKHMAISKWEVQQAQWQRQWENAQREANQKLENELKQCTLSLLHASTSLREELLLSGLPSSSPSLSSISNVLTLSEPLLSQFLSSQQSLLECHFQDIVQQHLQFVTSTIETFQHSLRNLHLHLDEQFHQLTKIDSDVTVRKIQQSIQKQLQDVITSADQKLMSEVQTATKDGKQLIKQVTDEAIQKFKQQQQQATEKMDRFGTIAREQLQQQLQQQLAQQQQKQQQLQSQRSLSTRQPQSSSSSRSLHHVSSVDNIHQNSVRQSFATYLSSPTCQLFSFTAEIELNVQTIDQLIDAAGGDVREAIKICKELQRLNWKKKMILQMK